MNKMKKKNIFIADDLHISGVNLLKENGFLVHIIKGLNNVQLLDYLKNADTGYSILIFRSVRKINSNFIGELIKFTNIRILCTASTGIDNVDVKYARRKKMKVLNVPEGNYISAAEHTFGMLLAIMKNIASANYDMKKGLYDYSKYMNHELKDKTIGIIGVGRVGSAVAKYARAFGMKILGNDIKKGLQNKYRWIKFVSKEVLVKNSDIVTLHTPLDSSTRNMMNRKRLSLMKKSSVLLNCARGGIVEEEALIKMLIKKQIYYAGIDVFENEPEINRKFFKLQNVILTPHLAGKTVESKERISYNLANQIIELY